LPDELVERNHEPIVAWAASPHRHCGDKLTSQQ